MHNFNFYLHLFVKYIINTCHRFLFARKCLAFRHCQGAKKKRYKEKRLEAKWLSFESLNVLAADVPKIVRDRSFHCQCVPRNKKFRLFIVDCRFSYGQWRWNFRDYENAKSCQIYGRYMNTLFMYIVYCLSQNRNKQFFYDRNVRNSNDRVLLTEKNCPRNDEIEKICDKWNGHSIFLIHSIRLKSNSRFKTGECLCLRQSMMSSLSRFVVSWCCTMPCLAQFPDGRHV